MPVFEIRPDGLVPVAATTFQAAGLRERGDIQRLLKHRIDCLEDGLMVLAEEFSGWLDSGRRIDLLCLDKEAKLVVVELKRGEDGGHMELQALRYAAMVSAITFEQAAQALASDRDPGVPDVVSARADILTFLGWDEVREEDFASDVRIILASADFSRELTTTVLWLRERDIDIRCTRLRPHRMEDGRLLVDIQSLIPLPEAEAFQTRLGDKRSAERKDRAERHDLRVSFLRALLDRAAGRSAPHVGRTPSTSGVLFGAIGRTGLSINYVTGMTDTRVELLLQAKEAKEQFQKLKQDRQAIEQAFGGPLEWMNPETRQCRIFCEIAGGYRSPDADWPNIHDKLIEAMMRLDAALRPFVAQLP